MKMTKALIKAVDEAVDDSIEHWHQNLDILILNYQAHLYLFDGLRIWSDSCALCILNRDRRGEINCKRCPLHSADYRYCCCLEWYQVNGWFDWRTEAPQKEIYKEGYKVITAMLNKLYSLKAK